VSGVRYEVDGSVAVVTLDRPDVLNALDLETGRLYNRLLRRADDDPAVRAVVVTGAGRAFCSGADVSGMGSPSDASAEERLPADALQPELAMLIRKPVVAAVNGAAIGVGLVLAAYADVRFVAGDAKLGFEFPRLGLVAEYGMAALVPWLVGGSRAFELLVGGRRFSGVDAVAWGLAHAAAPADEVLARALEYARDLAASCSPAAMAAAKEQLRAAFPGDLRRALDDARQRMLVLLDGDELAEGFAARAQRRTPSFAPLPALEQR
jgi:enoyl-CoA hydratase/carnithine racemase